MSALEYRVLQVTGSLGVGGAEMMILTAVRELVGGSLSFDFLVFGDDVGELEHEIEGLGCRILRMGAPSTLGPRRFVSQLADLIDSEGPYFAVHSHINLASGLVMAAANRSRVQIRVAHSHNTGELGGGIRRSLYRRLSKWLIRRNANRFAACGEEAGVRLFGAAWKGSGTVVPNGVDVTRFLAARDDRARLRHQLGVTDDGILVGAVARLVPFKNHAFMLEIVRAAVEQGIPVEFLIVGDGPLRGDLESQVDLMGMRDRVRFLGVRQDIPQVLAALDVVLMPSWHEGLPVSLIEAQASGTRTLASDAVTREADLGLGLVDFLPAANPAEWVEALLRVYSNVPSPAEIRMQFLERGYDVAASARCFASLYGTDQ